MRPLFYDSPDPEARFGNPNLRWGSPSYVLEPGDSGYVPPVPINNELTTKHKRMKRNAYYPSKQADQVVWLTNFCDKISGYATTLGLTAPQLAALLADGRWLLYLLQSWLPEAREWEKACTLALHQAESGSGALVLPVFTAPALPNGVTPQTRGSLSRMFAQIKSVKNSGKCTDEIAADLHIVGDEQDGPDPATVQPDIKAVVVGGQVHITWGYGPYRAWLDACEIVVDRGDTKGFVPLVMDTTPNYIDTETWPSKPTIWTYKAIYRADDRQIGRWSQPVSVTVGG